MGRDAHSTRFFFVLIFRRPVSRLKLREISIPAEISENAYAERRRAACPNRMALYAGDAPDHSALLTAATERSIGAIKTFDPQSFETGK